MLVAVFALVLAACAPAVAVPDRPIAVDVDTALAAQAKLANLMMGDVSWSESEFSSLLSVLLDQNTGDNNPVTSLSVWFEPDNQVFIRANLKDGVLPAAFGNTLDLSGKVMVDGGKVQLALDGASAGSVGAPAAVLAMTSDQINAALGSMMMVPASVATDSGNVTVSLGGM
jgi:hypothetical protein